MRQLGVTTERAQKENDPNYMYNGKTHEEAKEAYSNFKKEIFEDGTVYGNLKEELK